MTKARENGTFIVEYRTDPWGESYTDYIDARNAQEAVDYVREYCESHEDLQILQVAKIVKGWK